MEIRNASPAAVQTPEASLYATLWSTWVDAAIPPGPGDRALGKSAFATDAASAARPRRSLVDLVVSEPLPGLRSVAFREVLAMAEWEAVPEKVAALYKGTRPIAEKVRKLLKYLPHSPGYGYVFWHPEDKTLHAVLGDSDDAHHNRWSNVLKALPGVNNVVIADEYHPKNQEDWVLIKTAAPLGILEGPMQWAGKLTGGPSPLTNSIVGALLGGGLGYGGGMLAEQLLPERFVRRGRLRKTTGILGAVLGAAPGVWQAATNASAKAEHGGKPLGLSALWTPNEAVPIDPETTAAMNNYDYGLEKRFDLAAAAAGLAHLPLPERMQQLAADFVKQAFGEEDEEDQGAGGFGLRPVPLDAFGQAVWNDVRKGIANPYGTKSPWGSNDQPMHTPPQVAAATTGILGGLSQMYGGANLLSPMHFINGLAAAGVDLVTARVVGGTLGALGGLTPAAQDKLQDIGVWGGLIRGTVGSMLGHRGL